MITRRPDLVFTALALVCFGLIAASLVTGTESVSVSQAWREWRSDLPLREAPSLSVLISLRIPRTLLALLAGAGLALAGCSFQALLRNPLAEPYTLGVASAGAFGAATATILIQTSPALQIDWAGFSLTQVFAFAFAGADVLLIYLLAAQKSRMSAPVLLLAGVTIGILCNSGILFMRYLASPEFLVNMDRWFMGGVGLHGYEPVLTLLIGVTPCAILLLTLSGQFDQLGFGSDIAEGRGVNVKRLQIGTFLAGSLMTAIIVSKVGPIGFVGLIVPHGVRTITGSRHRLLMPATLFAGGAFLCFADIVSRVIIRGAETPIGVITAAIGAPFFLYLLARRRFTDWGG